MTIFMCIWEAIVFFSSLPFFFFDPRFRSEFSQRSCLCRLEYLVTDLLNINGRHLYQR